MKTIRLIYVCAMMLTMSACENFLDITPEGQEKRDDLLSTADGIEDAMYGVYSQMRGENLYGKELSFSALDIMAQYFYSYGNYKAENLLKYNYKYSTVESTFEGVWTSMYANISNANSVLNCDLVNGATEYPYSIYRGEALGLRAFMHFDLLRLFTEQITRNPNASGIPYATEFSLNTPDFSTAAQVYEKIIADLKQAESLLADEGRYVGESDYMQMRQIHFNVHAVRATLARVYLTMGNYEQAEYYARKVIDESGRSLVRRNELVGDVAGVLSRTEAVFGIYSATEFYSYVYDNLWLTTSFFALSPRSDYDTFYTSEDGSDYRLTAFFTTTLDGVLRFTKILDQYKKDSNEANRPSDMIPGINLIRLPEMYYIVAECLTRDGQIEEAAKKLDAVRASRGIEIATEWSVQTQETMLDLINADRYREWIGEGQSFYNMKRQNMTITNQNGEKISPSNSVYVVPVPDIEYDYRN